MISTIKTSIMPNKNRSAFTLIELLVVIAIIAILAAILFPVFGRARENARRSACQSNMKQIGLGILQYAQDYDDKFPGVGFSSSSGCTTPWAQNIQPYMKSQQVFRCPSNVNDAVMACTPTSARISSNYLGNGANYSTAASGGFGYDRPLDNSDDTDATGTPLGRSLAEALEPSRTISVVEYSGTTNRANVASTSSNGGFGLTNHLGSTNFLFVDGHVKSMKPIATITGGNLWALDPSSTGVHNTLRNALWNRQIAMQ